jgi:hypothetical protein
LRCSSDISPPDVGAGYIHTLFDLFGFCGFGGDTKPPSTAVRIDGVDSGDLVSFGLFDAGSLGGFETFPPISDLAENNSPLLKLLISPVATVGIARFLICFFSLRRLGPAD